MTRRARVFYLGWIVAVVSAIASAHDRARGLATIVGCLGWIAILGTAFASEGSP